MEKTIYLVVETEYAPSGNYRSNLEAYFSEEVAKGMKDRYTQKHKAYKERHPNEDYCVMYDIEEITLCEA